MPEKGGKHVRYKFQHDENVQKLMTLCEEH